MRKFIRDASRVTAFVMLLAIVLSSCVPQKRIKYLQRLQEQDTVSMFKSPVFDSNYRFKVRDNLYIRVFSLDPNATLFLNKQNVNTYNEFANDASVYLNSYTVDENGQIEFPVLGKVKVLGMTESEASAHLIDLVSGYLKEVTVVVKLVNFKVTIFGEVGRPGEFTFYQNRVNLFMVISMAGDMTEWANRSNVAIIRKTAEGSQVHYIDMNRIDVLTSPLYYVQPGDIIYVAPLAYKRLGLGSVFPWAFAFSVLTTTLLLINYFK